jgi:hypothetical protein
MGSLEGADMLARGKLRERGGIGGKNDCGAREFSRNRACAAQRIEKKFCAFYL